MSSELPMSAEIYVMLEMNREPVVWQRILAAGWKARLSALAFRGMQAMALCGRHECLPHEVQQIGICRLTPISKIIPAFRGAWLHVQRGSR